MKHMRFKPQPQSSGLRRIFSTLAMSMMLTSISLAQLEQTKIAFRSTRDGNSEIYVMNSDGTDLQNLTNHPAGDTQPSWSPVLTLPVSQRGKLPTLWGDIKRDLGRQ